jgi:hypothetical protein
LPDAGPLDCFTWPPGPVARKIWPYLPKNPGLPALSGMSCLTDALGIDRVYAMLL